jgi:hypothetical protein
MCECIVSLENRTKAKYLTLTLRRDEGPERFWESV